MSEKIKIMFLNQTRAGMAVSMEIEANTRIDDFLVSQLGETANFADIKIRMNGDVVTRTTIIPADARIIISMINVKGG